MHTDFVPQGFGSDYQPEPAVTLGAGTVWMEAYDAVTTKGGFYVQGGGCTTVGVAGLVLSGGFGSLSKRYGLAAASLLEAEIVTADGMVRIANAGTNPDLFWAIKGGGGGTFGIISKLTLRLHELPAFLGGASFKVKASSDTSFRRLIREFVRFYRESLFNEHWGEQAHMNPDNSLGINMVCQGLDREQARQSWQQFLDWIAKSPRDYSLEEDPRIGIMPARAWWDVAWRKAQGHTSLVSDPRPSASPTNAWWRGDGDQTGMIIEGYESLWLPASFLEDNSIERLADALFASSRYWVVELHFNKGLAGAAPAAIEAARDTAMNPAVLNAFALAIIAGGQKPAYPGIPGHKPDLVTGRKNQFSINRGMSELRAIAPNGGSYVSESNYFEKNWQESYWGANYQRLLSIKEKYDPTGLFRVHNGAGSEIYGQ